VDLVPWILNAGAVLPVKEVVLHRVVVAGMKITIAMKKKTSTTMTIMM
jgi:hypothetical protein